MRGQKVSGGGPGVTTGIPVYARDVPPSPLAILHGCCNVCVDAYNFNRGLGTAKPDFNQCC